MIETFRGLSVDDLAASVGESVLRQVRVPEPSALIRGVVLHTPSDPDPDRDLLVLCTQPDGVKPAAVAIAVREGQTADVLADVGSQTAVFAVPEWIRWSDVYDRVRWALRDSLGHLAGRDAFELADALATAIGGAVAIEDTSRRVVAFSTVPGQPIDDVRRQGILDRNVPEHVEREEWYARLWKSAGVEEFTGGTESTHRLAVAVRAGEETLGSIWVIGSRASLNPDADSVLSAAVPVVAARLAHQDQFSARGREARAEIVRQLLGGFDAGQGLGYALPGPCVLIAHRRDGSGEDDDLRAMRLADVLSLQALRFSGSGLSAAVDGTVYALFGAQDRDRLAAQIRRAVARTSAGSPAVGTTVVGRVVERAEDLPRAKGQVDRLLSLHERDGTGDGAIAFVDDAVDDLVLAEIADAVRDIDPLRNGVASAIAAHDRDHGTAYVPTLRAWFDTGGDVTAAAHRIHVHANTFRYRMSRVTALFDLDLDSPDERLLVHLQLRLADYH